MGQKRSYQQFCPVAKGAEIFAERWTPLVLRELLMGSTRFNDLRRGVPRMSQSVLAQRLKELEWAGIVEHREASSGAGWEYHLTTSGEELRPVVEHLGTWAYRWFQVEITEEDLDAGLLMLDMRRGIDAKRLPQQRVVIHFHFPDAGRGDKKWWLIFEDGEADLCAKPPGHPVDISLETSLLTMTQIWMGDMDFRRATGSGKLKLEGPPAMVKHLPGWIGGSMFSGGERQKATIQKGILYTKT